MTTSVRRPPGIAIDRVPAPTPRVLPRMDVAGFVGFAASGPVHVPVVVEDYAGFATVFGGPVRLAWDPVASRYAEAQLGPAVKAFFAGGGRRAHVLRVAGRDAERAQHPIPGLRQAVNGTLSSDRLDWARLVARAYGSWADSLAVSATLSSDPGVLTRVEQSTAGVLGIETRRGAINAGDLIRVRAASWTGYLPVISVEAPATSSVPSSPVLGDTERIVRVDAARTLWVEPDLAPAGLLGIGDPWALLKPGSTVERLELALWVRDTVGESWVLTGVGFVPGHPGYLGDLPTDEAYFTPREPLRGPAPAIWAAAGSPRFPLAAEPAGATSTYYYPVAVDVVPETFLSAVTTGRPARIRDGLAAFDPAVFLDEGMREAGVDTVLATAEYLRWQAPRTRRLTGIHALLDLEEVTVLAVPDAVQRPWLAEPTPPEPTAPPSPSETPQPDGCRRPPFADCDPPSLGPAPVLTATTGAAAIEAAWSGSPGAEAVRLSWSRNADAANYRLQLTTDPRSWDGARDIYLGPDLRRTFYGGGSGPRFFRVRAEAGALCTAWSDGVVVGRAGDAGYVVEAEADYRADGLLAVQRSLLRLCAARGDLLAVLSLPEHYRAADAIAHAQRLQTGPDVGAVVPPLDFAEQRALGFGALYHPWVGRVDDGANRLDAGVGWAPPDGAVAGIIARRALARGAWVAPANERLAEVVALRRSEPDLLLPALQAVQVNALRQTPGGFVCLAEDTLSTDSELRPVNVRRLISLVRRLAALQGTQYVFEPNDPTLRRAVERGFTDVLTFLFRLGAFAGRTPERAFRVEVGDPPNTPQSVELGRLVVELKFAPAQPLEFLLVRLVQAGELGFTLEVS